MEIMARRVRSSPAGASTPRDHDVARTCPELTGFLKILDEMFVQGRVFDDVQFGDEAAPNEGSRTTPARIAFEEVNDEYTVSYGNQSASSADVAAKSPSSRNAGTCWGRWSGSSETSQTAWQ